MNATNKTKIEIQKAQAKVALLRSFVVENLPFASANIENGFYTSAGDKFKEMSNNCVLIAGLMMEIQQLHFDLERIEAEQTEMALNYGAPPLRLNPL
jgi:hypothetical protein